MARAKKILAPTYTELIVPTYKALLALGGSGTNKATWKKDKTSWWFGCKGWYAKKQWQKIDDKWYYFDANGYITTGTKKIGGKTYRFNNSGACLNP